MPAAGFSQVKAFVNDLEWDIRQRIDDTYEAQRSTYIRARIKPLLARYRAAAARAKLLPLDFDEAVKNALEAEFDKTAKDVELAEAPPL